MGLIAWESIRDGRRKVLRHGRYDDVPDLLDFGAEVYRRDLWVDAPAQAQVWIEKEDLADALADRAHALG